MLYIWPFFAFFSLPLLLPCAVPLLDTAIALFGIQSRHPEADSSSSTGGGDEISEQRFVSSKDVITSNRDAGTPSRPHNDNSSPAKLSPALGIACLIFASPLPLWLLYLFATLAASAAIVKFNTIVHPFTLADNRHYMFYIFRYTVRRGSLVRLLLIVPYTLTRWMVWATLAGFPDLMTSTRNAPSSSSRHSVPHQPPGLFTSHAFRIAPSSQERPTSAAHPKDANNAGLTPRRVADPLATSCESISTSTALVFLLATALSLMTAPLVEPRYFILPWVMWRLLVPAWRIHGPHPSKSTPAPSQSRMGQLLALSERYDARLVLETLWLMAVNLATGYIFLTKPYIWKDENGVVLDGGRLQRFMW